MISIAMATYNGEKFLEKQIYSILHQTILTSRLLSAMIIPKIPPGKFLSDTQKTTSVFTFSAMRKI